MNLPRLIVLEPHLVVHDVMGCKISLTASALAAQGSVMTVEPSDRVFGPLVHIQVGGWAGYANEGWGAIAERLEALSRQALGPAQKSRLDAHAAALRAQGAALNTTPSEATQ